MSGFQSLKIKQQKTIDHVEIEIDHTIGKQTLIETNPGQCLATSNIVKEENSSPNSLTLSKNYSYLSYFDPSQAPLLTTFKLKKDELHKIVKYRQVLEKQDLKFQQSLRQSDDSQIACNVEQLVKIEQVEQISEQSPFIIVKNHQVSTSRIAYSWKKKRQMMKFGKGKQYLPTLLAMKQKNRVYAKRAIKQAQKIAKTSNVVITPYQIFKSIAFSPYLSPEKIENSNKVEQQNDSQVEYTPKQQKNKKVPKQSKSIRKPNLQKKKSKAQVQDVEDKYSKKVELKNLAINDELQWQTNKPLFYSKFFHKIMDLERRKLQSQ